VPGTGIEPVRGKPPQDFKCVITTSYVTHSTTKCSHVLRSTPSGIASGFTTFPVRKGTVRDRFGGPLTPAAAPDLLRLALPEQDSRSRGGGKTQRRRGFSGLFPNASLTERSGCVGERRT
jgi:hypothetical protein